MAIDPRRLKPGELCKILNSTPAGEVIHDGRLRRHRAAAGLRIGEHKRIDLVRYTGWLVHQRHKPKPKAGQSLPDTVDLATAAQGAAAIACRQPKKGKGPDLTSRQESLIATLLTEATYTAAAEKAGVGISTLYRWMHQAPFRAAYRRARRELVEGAIGRVQAASGAAVDALVAVARLGRREGDRIRAAVAILDHAVQGLGHADIVHGEPGKVSGGTIGTTEVVSVLAGRLRQLETAEMSTAEKSRLASTLSETLLRAIAVDVIDKRLEAVETVLGVRKDKDKDK